MPLTSPSNAASATSVRLVSGSADDVRDGLARAPRFEAEKLPAYLRAGFPTPVSATGSGLEVGSRREVFFAAGGKRFPAVFEVTDSAPGRVRFRRVSDASPVSNWLAWDAAEVRWAPAGDGKQSVTWELRYRRLLSPSWYFGPAEAYAAGLSADYLSRSLTP